MDKPVILGAGLAGLSVALALAPMPVILVSPCPLGEGCSSAWAQGGIAAAMGTDDSATLHATDTMRAGAGLNDAAIVEQTTDNAPALIEKLIALGVAFDHEASGNLRLGLEAAHQKRRIVHARDATGFAVMQALIAAVRVAPSIEIIENATAQSLIVENGVTGVVLQCDGEQKVIATSRVVLATGGAAALWRDTTNPHTNWGSGLALAARAGAALGDLEFMQFHPTAMNLGRDPMPLASEALRGEGATLVDETGARFTDELQPRDIVTRAIWQKIGDGHQVFLDARHLGDAFAARFPTIHALCRSAGIDPATVPIPVRPAAHYHMGGVVTDAFGRTNVPGLWACGEVACTGLHGANRLASNSLLEAAHFGARVAEDIVASSFRRKPESSAAHPQGQNSPALQARSNWIPAYAGMTKEKKSAEIRAIMSDTVGVIRDRKGLEKAVAALSLLAQDSDMALAGLMIAVSALRREESRGAHFRSDFPKTAAHAQRNIFHLADLENFL